MKKLKLVFYISTGLLTLSMLMGVYTELTLSPASVAGLAHLGYPAYLNYILGTAKLLGLIALWQNKFSFLKEWAYAGFVIDVVGAAASILFVGDPVSVTFLPLVNLAVIIVSYVSYRKMKMAVAVA